MHTNICINIYNLQFLNLSLESSDAYLTLQFSLLGALVSRPTNRHPNKVIRPARERPVVAVMDANAKSPIWSSHETCERGEAFEIIILDCNLYLPNDPAQGPTYERPGVRSFIDLSMVSASIFHRVAQ